MVYVSKDSTSGSMCNLAKITWHERPRWWIFFACVFEYERSQAGDTNRRFLYVFCQDLTKWIALCSTCQAASSSSVGMKKLRELKEFVAVEGKDRLDSELEGLSRDVLRQVSQAADLPVKVSGQTLTASELRHALLGVLIPSEEQEEAGALPRSHKMDCLVFSMSGSFKQQCRDEETSGIERVRSCRR